MSEQQDHLDRVGHVIAGHIIAFAHELGTGVPFHCEELRRYVTKREPAIAPASPDRVLRDLRKKKVLNYHVLDRRASKYEFAPIKTSQERRNMRRKQDLRDGQQDIVTELYQNDEKICVLRPGGGKTISALTAFQELLRDGVCRHALVLAPKRVARTVWPDEIAEWDHVRHLRYMVLSESPAERTARLATAPGRELTIVGHDIIDWLLNQIEDLPDDHPLFDLLVIDEISRFRNPKSERYKLLIRHVHRWKMIWGLSGTLRPSSTLDLFCPVRLVTRAKLWGKSFYQWQKQRFYPADFNGYKWEAKPGFEDIINTEIAPLIVTAEMPKLPEPTIIFDRVELPDTARVKYQQMERRLFAVVEDEKVVADSMAIAVGKLGQIANGFIYDETSTHRVHNAKYEWLKDLIENASEPTLLIYEFQEDFRMLRELLPDLPYLGAGISDKQADRNIKAWNARQLPFMGLHPASGGHGLNLQHGGADMAWISPTWNSELWDQTLARLHRSGQPRQVVVRVCVANDTIDDAKIDRVYHKLSAQEAFERYLQRVRMLDA